MKRLEGKVALVTGGARGIGKAVCKILAAEGAKVAVTDVIDEEGEQVTRRIQEEGGDAEYHHMDTTMEEEVSRVFSKVAERYGDLTVLVNNAGISGTNEATENISLEEWRKVMDINVTGVFLCTKHAIPYMKKAGGGSIVNLSSIYGIVSAPDRPPYHASKGAVRLMTKTDALLYAKERIRVNSVHPGLIWTPLVEKSVERSEMEVEDFREELASRYPVGRVGEPEDIAYGIAYLASDEAKFVTGSELVIDGGYTAQ